MSLSTMPNWIEQELHVVGSKSDVDRFVRTGFSRQAKDRIDDLLDLRRLCPLKRGEPKSTYTHDSAVVLLHFRTRTQAFFSMMTGWDYPAEFYARLAIHWPSLAFACTVNGEMGDFGGIIVVLDGKVVNLCRTTASAATAGAPRPARSAAPWTAGGTSSMDFDSGDERRQGQ